jgi:hypothetical protein
VEKYIQKVVDKDFIVLISTLDDTEVPDGIPQMRQRTASLAINTLEEILLNLPLGYEIVLATHNTNGFNAVTTRHGSTQRQS